MIFQYQLFFCKFDGVAEYSCTACCQLFLPTNRGSCTTIVISYTISIIITMMCGSAPMTMTMTTTTTTTVTPRFIHMHICSWAALCIAPAPRTSCVACALNNCNNSETFPTTLVANV